jgi:hypothetical protein
VAYGLVLHENREVGGLSSPLVNKFSERANRCRQNGFMIALYLWLILGLLTLHKSMILAEHRIDFTYHGLALINALALSKVMLVARHLHWATN